METQTKEGIQMRAFHVARGYEEAGVELPSRGTKFSAGYDFRTLTRVELKPGEQKVVPTGVKAEMDGDDVLLVFPRSSVGIKKGVVLANTVGVIDADYYNNPDNDGHILIALKNLSDSTAVFEKGERIAQGIFVKYGVTSDDKVLSERKGGTGSTGK